MASTLRTRCPCGRPADYAQCCGPLHAGTAVATTAEQLMRSRYSAYVRRDEAYLLTSWHASTRPAALDLAAQSVPTWLGLEVKRYLPDGDHAVVEFIARLRHGGGKAQRMHEVSRFVREDGRWYYVDGDLGGH